MKLRRHQAKLVLKLNVNTEKLPITCYRKKQGWNVNIFSPPPQQEMTMHEIDKKSLQLLELKNIGRGLGESRVLFNTLMVSI